MSRSEFGSVPFIPGSNPSKPELLARHLPPIPEGIVSSWLHTNLPEGAWVLDPFGASPRIALEAAQAGYRVLVTANNPIARFLLEMITNPPSADELKAALAELAASYVGEERMEPHIRSLYNTICARCGQIISAEAFLWEYGNPAPYARIYTCPYCGDAGEHPGTAIDATNSGQFVSSGLHKARALERVVAFNDQDRIHVEQALGVYHPRALYALLTIINKLEGLNLSPASQKHLAALLLYTFDQSNSMWRPQAQADRRRQLSIPRHSRENNVWSALEEGINKWCAPESPAGYTAVPVTIWPSILTGNQGICIYEGRLVNLIDSIEDIDIKSVCAAIPRPNQAYWTLCALWAGWLWGREAVGSFKSVLHRQRYDWAWHTNALASVFKQLANYLPPDTPIFGMIGEAEPGFIGSALVASAVAGCHLESMAIRPEGKQAQFIWKSERGHEISQVGSGLTSFASQSARRFLEINGEPESYLSTISAGLSGILNHWHSRSLEQGSTTMTQAPSPLSDTSRPAPQIEPTPSVIYSNAYNAAREALSYRSGFLRYNLQDEKDIESSSRSQDTQASLFSQEVMTSLTDEDETSSAEISSSESESAADREQPVRSSDVSETTHIWLRETKEINQKSSTDTYEEFLVRFLINHPNYTSAEIDSFICSEFTGLLTPNSEFIHLFLDSYGLPDPSSSDHWTLRPEDYPSARQSDIAQMQAFIHQIGARLGFDCLDQVNRCGIPYTLWQTKNPDLQYWFFTTASAAIGEMVIHGEQPAMKGFIVVPASRTNLLIYKLRRDTRLSRAFNPTQGVWQFLKFRHLRALAESPSLNRENLDQFFQLDPLTYLAPQLWLI